MIAVGKRWPVAPLAGRVQGQRAADGHVVGVADLHPVHALCAGQADQRAVGLGRQRRGLHLPADDEGDLAVGQGLELAAPTARRG